MSELSQKTLHIIEDKKIIPRPRWQFLLRDYMVWISFGVSIILGALSVTTTIFMLTSQDWDIYEYLNRSLLEHVLVSLPYFWFAALIILVAISYYNFKHTKHGYRYSVLYILLGSLVGSVILGTALFAFGFDSEIHETLSERVPVYNKLVYDKKDIWKYAERGLLSGEITKFENTTEFTLQDLNKKTWTITLDKNIWPTKLLRHKGVWVKLIGQQQSTDIFHASTIRPWSKHSIK